MKPYVYIMQSPAAHEFAHLSLAIFGALWVGLFVFAHWRYVSDLKRQLKVEKAKPRRCKRCSIG